jgi:hypothetical protein
MRLLVATIVIGLALAVAGVARSPAEVPAPNGSLVVREHQLPADGIYTEGYVSFLHVRDEATGEIVIRKRFNTGKVHLRTELPPGAPYRVTRFIRPCDGNCGYLDPPTERCRQSLVLQPGSSVLATVRTRVGDPCEIRLRYSD